MAYKKKTKQEYMKNRKETLIEITEKLEKGITDMMNSDEYKRYLSVMSRFHNYSFNNTILIAMQRPDATLIAGYESWRRKFGRQVRKGEKGIKIIVPAPYKKKEYVDSIDDNGNPIKGADGATVKKTIEITVPAFKVATVFDISSTDGKEIPTIGVAELQGHVNRYKELIEALMHVSPVPVEMTDIDSGAKGYFSPIEQKICVQKGMSEAQTVKTLIHEIAHSLKDDKEHQRVEGIDNSENKTRNSKEVESESIAYTVSAALSNMGIEIDTSDYSFGYIAGWSSDKDLSELRESLEVIRIVSDKIISGIEDYFEIREYQKDIAMEMADELADEHMRKEIKEADMDAKEVKCEAIKNSIVAANIVGAAVVVGADVVADIDKKQETFKDRLCDAKRIIEHTNEKIVDKKVKGIKSKGLEV